MATTYVVPLHLLAYCICEWCVLNLYTFLPPVADLVYSSVLEALGQLRGQVYSTRVDGEQIIRLLDSSNGPASNPITRVQNSVAKFIDHKLSNVIWYYIQLKVASDHFSHA